MGRNFTRCVGGGCDPVVNRKRTQLSTVTAAKLYIHGGCGT